MYKKIIYTLSLVILTLSFAAFAAADDVIELTIDNPQAFVNGVATQIDPDNSSVTPIIRNDRTLLPVRFIAETLGMEVDWNPENRRVTLTGNGRKILLTIDSSWAEIDGQQSVLDVEPMIYADRTYLPLRFISETLDKKVDWDGVARKVTVKPIPPGNPPEDAFNGLKFRPVFNNGLANSSLNLDSGFGMSMDTSSVSISYGKLDNFMGQEVLKGFPKPANTEGLTYTVLAEKAFGKERLALISAKSEIIAGPGVTIIGPSEFTTDMIFYLAVDETANYFLCASISGTTQEHMEELNRALENYR